MTQTVWDGGGSDNFWGTAANWGGDVAPSSGVISFGGTVQTSTNNNLTADTLIGGINFTNTLNGQAFTLSGNRIRLGGNIVTSTMTGGGPTNSITDVINLDLVLTGNRTITTAANVDNGNHHLTINGIISETGGSFGFTKNGGSGGILTLTNVNTFSGTVTLVSGTLSFNTIGDSGVASALGSGGMIVAGNSGGSTGTLRYTGAAASTNRQIQIGSGATGSSTVGVIVQNDGSGALSFTNSIFNPAYATGTSTKVLTLSGSNSDSNTIQGVIADNSAANGGFIALTKDGSGLWILAGNNTFSGQVRIDQGTLSVASLSNTGVAGPLGTGNSNENINIGSGSSTGTLIYTGSTDGSTNRRVQIGRSTVNSGGATLTNNGTGSISFTNTMFNVSDTTITSTTLTRTLTLNGTNTGSNVISGVISNNTGASGADSPIAVTKSGTGSWTLSGVNTFTGQVRIEQGSLSVTTLANTGSSSSLGTGASNALINIGASTNTGTLIYTGTTNSITNRQIQIGRSISATGGAVIQNDGIGMLTFSNPVFNVSDTTITSTAALRTLTLQGTNNRLNTISGVISNNTGTGGVIGVVSLVKAGTGTWNLSAANTYTGTTTISGGVLDVGNLSNGSLGTGGLIFSNGAVLQGNGTFTRTFSGTSTAAAGQLTGASGGFSARGGTLIVDFGGAGAPVLLSTGSSRFGTNFTFGSSTADSPVIVINPLSTNGDFNRTFTVTAGVGGDYAELRGGITDTGSVTKAGNGLLILTGNNTVTGILTISAGILQIGSPDVNSGTTGTMPFSSVTNDGLLIFNRSDALSFANVISGSGSVTQAGVGTTTLSATNSYTGVTTINAGVLQIGTGGTAGNLTGTSSIINNASLVINRSNAITLSAPITGSGTLTKQGAGVATLTGSNTYSGGTTISAGTLLFRNSSSMPATGPINVAAGATLAVTAGSTAGLFNADNITALLGRVTGSIFMDSSSFFGIEVMSDSFTFNSDISSSVQGFSKTGAGTLVLRGNNSYNGTTLLAGGVLDVGTISSSSLPSGGLLFSNNAILQGNGSFTRTFSGSSTAGTNQLTGTSGGFAAKGGQLTINFGGSGNNVNLNTGASRFGTNFVFGSPDADSRVLLVNTFTLGTASRTFTVNSGLGGDFVEFSGTISSSSVTDGITKAGPGLLVFSANNAITGSTTISAGTLQLGAGGTTGAIGDTTGILNNGVLAINRSNAISIVPAISGTGVVRQIGTGITTLQGLNTYSGGTVISSGGLLFTSPDSMPDTGLTTVAAGAMLALRVGSTADTFSTADLNAAIAGTLAGGIAFAPGAEMGIDTTPGDFSFNTSFASAGLGLGKLGPNVLTLTGAANSGGTATTRLAGGVLDVGPMADGLLPTGGLFFSGDAVLQGSGTFTRTFSGTASAGTNQLTGTTGGFAARGGMLTLNFGGAAASLQMSTGQSRFGVNFVFGSPTADSRVVVVNPINLNQLNRTFTVLSGLGGDAAELQGVISGTEADDGIIKAGPGLLILSATNTYTGATVINAGTLQLGNGGSFGAILNTSSVTNNATLSFNRSNNTSLPAPISGTGLVNQLGTGVTTLSGSNTYSGGTNVNSGTLVFLAAASRPATGQVNVAAGATLGLGVGGGELSFTEANLDALFAGTLAGVVNDVTSRVGIDTTPGNFTYSSSIPSTTRGLQKLGSNTLTLTGTNAYTGNTQINAGILRLGSAGAIPGGISNTGGISNIVMSGGIIGLTAESGDFTRSTGTGVGQIRWITDTNSGFAAYGGTRTVNFGGNSTPSQITWSNTGGVLGSGLLLGAVDSDGTIVIANPIALNLNNGARTITVTRGSAPVDAVMAGAITSTITQLIKAGNGILALTGANNYNSGNASASTLINAGTLQLGNGGTSGSLAPTSGSVSVAAGATFAFNRSDAGLTVANLITGAGQVRQAGVGTTTLTAANSYTGGTTVASGTLLVNSTTGSGTGTGSVLVATGAVLGGNGRIAPTGTAGITIDGQLAPGLPNAAGTLTLAPETGDVVFSSTSSLLFQLFGASSYDSLAFAPTSDGLLDFTSLPTSGFDIVLAGGYSPQPGESFRLLDWGALTSSQAATGLDRSGLFDFSAAPLADGQWFWDTSAFAATGFISVGIVPEPGRALLVGLGTLALLARRRRVSAQR